MRPNQARLDLEALRQNLALARELAPRSRVMAVVKANAYGHGAVTIATALDPLVDALAVACLEEAIELREAGVSSPILLLQGVFDAEELPVAARKDLWITVENQQQLGWLEQAQLPEALHCWLKIDTGMHRLGVPPDSAGNYLQRLQNCENACDNVVLSTHFASADELASDQTPRQLAQFERACRNLPGLRSAANSPGVLGWPDSHYDWIRPGYMLYGNSPFPGPQVNADRLRPVMTLTSSIISLRQVAPGETVGYGATWSAERSSTLATVTIGYGDGYPRLAPNGTPVLVAGQRASLAGRVSMDMITVDVTDLDQVKIGDEVILWGPGLPAGEVARHAGTIGYELTTRMPARTPRVVSRS